MRRTVIIPVVLHALAAVATLLWLLWYFIPTGNVFKGLATLLILLLAGWTVFKNYRREQPVSDTVVSATDLPLPDTQGPVVLVCGDMPDALFQRSPLRKTAQGWWLRIGDVSRLTDVVRNIQTQFPRQVGQLSVMYRCLPDHHQDEAVLRSALKTLRQQCKQIQSLTGFTLPVVLSAEFSGPETPWIIVRGDKPVVCPVNDSPQAFIDWQQAEDNILALPAVSEAFSFIRNTLADELEKPDRLTPPVRAFSVAMRLGVASPETQSVWSAWLCSRTCLQFSRKPAQSVPAGLFPDAVLPLLAPFASTVQGGQRTRRLVLLMWLCALTALGISALNNRDLIHHVGASLQRWNAIPMNHYRPKAESLAALKQDALLLERWQRQGEPLRYSLGYYPGHQVKPDFDREGTEPAYGYLWLRMAKPYAGETLGWHTPLIDGTEVAIAYSNGDIDLPYIAYALHDSEHPDHVTRDNPTRNVLRTPANNKLRMEDKRGEEHIKLATEYGKTQLNSGHLVDSQGQRRGQGTELRTDEWGTLRAGKGLFVSADAQAKAQGDALDMSAALKEIDRLNQQLQQLEMAAEKAQALKGDVDSQIQMFELRLKPLNEAVLFSAPEGMALTSGEDMQLAAERNLALNAGEDFSVGVMGNATALIGEKLGLFARTGQLSLKSGEGPIDVQAQNASMRLFAEKTLTLSSAGDISFAGKKRITLIGGGSYLRLEAGKVEYGTTATYIRKVKRTMAAGANSTPTSSISMPLVEDLIRDGFFDEQFRILNDSGKPMANVPYFISSESGETFKGVTDNQGLCKRIFSKESSKLTVWLGVQALEKW
ncbi:DUF2345 domain-containing protein [Klebsiella michiganensis]|uniref:DUF2345 domain-containing protein n=1 Tax=Klebsiella michiganensis TaxID=1134687 RepID=UPI001F4F4B4E|nr:type VI secretion system Vgr family protein [Klebsiella michiganensis]MDK3050379.1 type VI secretion system Vgr family protein [Klebsiella michiganensis]